MHTADSDCTVINDECSECGVYHGDPCPICGGRGFHALTCEVVNGDETREQEGRKTT